ncbi:ABC transporter substrate-binding protein [Halovenus marina]|uniref:ABC transporter substrate-binding protein n=1 Tax=Halovenus marina TaxID=3396621 RepID=UPI003F56A78C
MSNKDEGKGTVPTTRRNWIKAIAIAGGAGSMAGCLGGGDDDGGDDSTGDGEGDGNGDGEGDGNGDGEGDGNGDGEETPTPDGIDELVPPGEAVNIDDLNTQLGETIANEGTTELAGQLGWIFNQWVHGVQVEDTIRGMAASHDPWDWQVSSVAPEYNAEQPWTYLARTQHLRHQDGDEEQFFELPAFGGLGGAHYNFAGGPWAPGWFFGARALFDEPAFYSPVTGEYFSSVFNDWEFDTTSAEVSIREDMSWNKQGPDLVADHVVDQWKMLAIRGVAPGTWIESWDVQDDYTISIEYPETRITAAKKNILGGVWQQVRFYTHPVHHRQFIDRWDDGESADSILSDVSEYRIGEETVLNEGVTLGPVAITSIDETRVEAEFVDDYPFGQVGDYDDRPTEPNYAGFAFTDHGDAEIDYQQAAVNNDVHAFSGDVSETVRDQFPDYYDLYGYTNASETAVLFSPNASPFGDDSQEGRAVRQAIAHAYDNSEFINIYGEDFTEPPGPNKVNGLTTLGQNNWLGDVLGDLNDYGNAEDGWSDMEMANTLMEAAGYTKESGNWVDEDGNTLSTELLYPSEWSALELAIQNIAEQLSEFGIQTSTNTQQDQTIQNETFVDHDFQLVFHGTAHDNPWQAYPNIMGDTTSPDGTRYNNQLSEVTVPWPPAWEM